MDDSAPLALEPHIPTHRAEELFSLLDGQIASTPQRLATLEIIVIRELTPDDVLAAAEGSSVAGPTSLASIKHAHHRIAQLLVEGASSAKVSLLTGYSPSYVARLQGDPAFRELLAYYGSQAEVIHVDVLERMKVAGLSALDELTQRLEAAPGEWTKKDLMEFTKLTLPQLPAGTGMSTGPTGPAIALNVQFVNTPQKGEAAPGGQTIDITATRVKDPAEEI